MVVKKKIIIKFVAGLFLGYFISVLLAGPATGQKGIMPSIIFKIKDYQFHFHHWFLFFLILVLQLLLDISLPTLFNGFLVGGAIQGIINYSDWYQIVSKVVYLLTKHFV